MTATALDLEEHRSAVTGHCDRMLGSPADAGDAVRETMPGAWRGLGRFAGRASLRTRPCRTAMNVCLDARSERPEGARRLRPMRVSRREAVQGVDRRGSAEGG